jgi:hypothetical protein
VLLTLLFIFSFIICTSGSTFFGRDKGLDLLLLADITLLDLVDPAVTFGSTEEEEDVLVLGIEVGVVVVSLVVVVGVADIFGAAFFELV